MVNYLRGVKSGAVSGFVSSFIIYCIVLILSLITGSIEPKQTLGITLAISTSFSMWIVISAVFGAILGVIYAVLYSKLPGDNSIKKAILFSFLVFILSTLIPLLAFSVQYSYSAVKEIPISEILSEQFWIFFYALIQFPIFGFLLGKLWDNFGTNEMVTDYSKPMNPKGIKSWHIAAAAVVPTLIVGLFLIGIDILGMLLGEYSETRGYGIMIGSFFLVVSGILAIPAVLLKTDNRKKNRCDFRNNFRRLGTTNNEVASNNRHEQLCRKYRKYETYVWNNRINSRNFIDIIRHLLFLEETITL